MKKEATYHIASVDHALQLLQLLKQRPSIRVAEAAEELGVARSTAHRLLGMLVHRGFAVQSTTNRSYLPGPELIETGVGALSQLDVRQKARPFLERLVASTGETASLQIMEGREARFVDSVESTDTVRVGSRVGVNLPAHVSSGGKALLAMMSVESLHRLYPDEELDPFTARSRRSRAEFEEELEKIREQGYALNYRESRNDLVAIAVPVIDRNHHPVAALSIAGPLSRMDEDAVERGVAALKEAAAELSASLYL